MIAKMKIAAPWLIGLALVVYLVFFTQLKLYVGGLLILGAVYFAISAVLALNPQHLKEASHWRNVGLRVVLAFGMLVIAGGLTMIGPMPTFPDSKDCIPPGRYDVC